MSDGWDGDWVGEASEDVTLTQRATHSGPERVPQELWSQGQGESLFEQSWGAAGVSLG